jgi:hypothetical protein
VGLAGRSVSRDDGFTVADMDTTFFADPKIRNLWRMLGDESRMARAVVLYLATVLESWRSGGRVLVTDSAPVWLPLDSELIEALKAAKLLDSNGRLPIRSWKSWHDPAQMRRDARRESGRLGGLRAKGQRSYSDATALLQRPDSDGVAKPHPSVRTVRPTVRPGAPAREGEAVQGTNGRGGLVPLADLVTPEALAAAGRKP